MLFKVSLFTEEMPKLDAVLQDLLAQQLVAVQRVLAYNQEITKRLGDAGTSKVSRHSVVSTEAARRAQRASTLRPNVAMLAVSLTAEASKFGSMHKQSRGSCVRKGMV